MLVFIVISSTLAPEAIPGSFLVPVRSRFEVARVIRMQMLADNAFIQGFDTQTSNGEWMQKFLQEKYPDIYAGDGIKWNFTKFLIGRNGQVHDRYETTTEIQSVIESLLLR